MEYLTRNRYYIEEHGKNLYESNKPRLANYIKDVNQIYGALSVQGDSEERFRRMYSRKPCIKSQQRLERLKGLVVGFL